MKKDLQQGVSLIESLVSLFLLSLGISFAGLLFLKSETLKTQAQWRDEGDFIAFSIKEASKLHAGNKQKPKIEVDYWQTILSAKFPGSLLEVNCDHHRCQTVIKAPKTSRFLETLTFQFLF